MNRDEMKNRTKEFCNRIIKLCRKLSDNRGGRLSKLRIVDFGFWIANCGMRRKLQIIKQSEIRNHKGGAGR
jgi:hypothetical protein